MSSAPPRPPNVVFILGDDWGWGDLGCFGHGQLRTPHLDRMAAEGTRYTQFYVASAVCSPSRAAFMTGRFPGAIGVHAIYASSEQNRAHGVTDFLDPAIPTLPRLLRERGYATAHFGKWHLGRGDGAPAPGAYGFDTHLSTHSSGPRWPGVGDITEAGHTAAEFQPRSSEVIVDSTIDFIRSAKDQPFYVQAWLLDPHAVLNPTAEQMAPYRNLSPKGVSYPGAPTVYYAVITNADCHIGRLLDALDALDLAEDTLVVFTGDNGPEDLVVANASHSAAGSPGPLRGRKRSLYEGGVRMPLIVRWKGHTTAGRVDNQSVLGAVDLLPTLCRLAGAPAPADPALDGEDVSDALHGHVHRCERPLLWEWRFPIAGHSIHKSPRLAIRDGDWKLLLNPTTEHPHAGAQGVSGWGVGTEHPHAGAQGVSGWGVGDRLELYDIPRDPMELRDLADRHPEVADRLAVRALDWAATLPPGPISPLAGSNAYAWPS